MAQYKIATIGSKGKERCNMCILNMLSNNVYPCRFMATVCVEKNQYKTYPDTYQTQAEAEEALASIVLTKLGAPYGSFQLSALWFQVSVVRRKKVEEEKQKISLCTLKEWSHF